MELTTLALFGWSISITILVIISTNWGRLLGHENIYGLPEKETKTVEVEKR